VVVHVGLTDVFVLEVLVGHVRMLHGGVVVLVLVCRAEMLEPTGHGVVVVGYMEVLMGVFQRLVLVFDPTLPFTVLGHRRLLTLALPAAAAATTALSYPGQA
jgi:hypothetical protein